MGGGLGDTLMYETAHPEPATLPRRYPEAERIRCIGGLDPAPFNGLARGLGLAVHDGKMTLDEAVDFILGVLKNKFGSVTGWRHALRGMIGQVRRKESGAGTLIKFLVTAALRRTYPYRGGLLVRLAGTRDGKPAAAVRRTPTAGEGSYLMRDMAAITGTSCAAFMVLALDESGTRAGAFAPGDWAEPQAFYKALQRVGTPSAEVVEAVV